ncbi:MAG: HD domain-containing protein [Bacilli bacterium]|nr:HD domain-containing protein [Bacilli bacterium]
MKISALRDGDRTLLRVVVKDCKKCVSNNGKNYFTLALEDASGSLDARKWDVNDGDSDIFAKGNFVEVDLSANTFDKKMQGKVFGGRVLRIDEVSLDELIPSAPIPLVELHNKCKAYIAEIEDPVVLDLVKCVFNKFYKKYREWPAAVSNHHNYLHGLLYHSLTMADLAREVAKIYPALNRDILVAGAMLHDIGKTLELSGPIATSYTLEGKLVGHLVLGQDIVREAANELHYFDFDTLPEEEQADKTSLAFHKKEVAVIFEHILISHHNQPEFGAAIRPLTRESQAIAMIDDIDAKMMILSKAYEGIEKGEWTAKIYSMDNRYFYKPMYTKDEEEPAGTRPSKDE